jgi:hypothetical protein
VVPCRQSANAAEPVVRSDVKLLAALSSLVCRHSSVEPAPVFTLSSESCFCERHSIVTDVDALADARCCCCCRWKDKNSKPPYLEVADVDALAH